MIHPILGARAPKSSLVYERQSSTTEQNTQKFVTQCHTAHHGGLELFRNLGVSRKPIR